MKIYIVSSMVFAEKMIEIKQQLERLGHDVLVTEFIDAYPGKSEKEKEKITLYHKNQKNAIRRFWERFQNCDAILVVNFDRRGVRNYIGGNTLMEIGFAYVLNKKIFLLNPIPEIEFYKTEIEAMKPTVINGDLSKIR